MTAAIEARDLRVALGGMPIVRGVDLTVDDGEVVAVLGANGSGKSTLVRALLGIVPLTGGSISLMGAPLGHRVPWDRIGYVPQRVSAATGVPATALEVVLSGTVHRGRLLPPRGARAQAAEALDAVGLGPQTHRAVRELSGGQQQRVLIARALVRAPRLLFLDEPVAGVDLPSQQAFATVLDRLVADGTTVVVVLHEVGPLSRLVSRAVVLRHGAVVHDGAPPAARPDHAGSEHVHVHPHDGDENRTEPEPSTAPTVRW